MSSVINILLGFIFTLCIGYVVVKSGGKLRYLAPICFISVACIVLFLKNDWEKAQFFSQWVFSPNDSAVSVLIVIFYFRKFTYILFDCRCLGSKKKVFF